MLKVLVLLQVALLTPNAAPHDPDDPDNRRAARRNQRGSVTIEHVLWAVAVIAFVGIVVAAITTYVQAQSGKIK